MDVAVAGRLDVLQSRRARTATFTAAVGASAVLAVGVSDAAPTGLRSLDELYIAAFGAAVAFFAGSARRWTWFLPAAVGAAFAADNQSLALATAAIGIGFYSVLTDTRSRARGAVVAGLGMGALLHTEPVGFHGLTALLAGVAVVPVIYSGYHLAARRVRRRVRRIAFLLSLPIGLMGIGLAVGVFSTYEDLYKGMDRINDGVVAARDAEADAAALRLTEASRHLNSAADTLDSWFVRPARALPVVGQNLRAVEQLAGDSADVARVSALAATSADVDAIRFTDGRLDLDALEAMIEPLASVRVAMEQARAAVDDVRSPWLVDLISSNMEELRAQVNDNLPDLDNAVSAVQVGHTLLGGEGTPRRYLVLFTTPTEARGRAGFPGNYAELVADDGKLSMVRFGRISELDNEGVPSEQRALADPALREYLDRYGRFEPYRSWRNITMSPDLPTIALAARELYPQSGGAPIDGLLTVDPAGLAALMNFTGPIGPQDLDDPGGLTHELNAENVEQFLLHDQYVELTDRSQRIDFLSDVAEETFERLTTNADVPSPREVIDILDPVVESGHIQFTTFQPQEGLYFIGLGLAGAFDTPDNDLVSLVTSNAGANKIDYYLQRGVRYAVNWDPATGAVSGTITATLTNNAPPTGLPDYIIGNDVEGLPRGTNRSFVSIYTPYDISAARIDGVPVAIESGRELGNNVYSKFVNIPSGATVTIELDVTGTWVESRYGLVVPPQPVVNPDLVDVTLTVAGDRPIEVDGEGVTVEGRNIRWTGDLTRAISIITDVG